MPLLKSAHDIGDAYVIGGGYIDVVQFGPQPISISKIDGSISAFNLPNEEHFKLLENGTKMELDEKYIVYKNKED